MSTILKALRRLEEDRSAQSERPLREEVTRGPGPSKPRRGGGPLMVALLVLGLGVAGAAGFLAYRHLVGTPEPAEPTAMAAADSAKPSAKPPAAAERARRPSAARSARKRASPPPAVASSAAAERELPAAALASKVEVVKRPPAQPRIAGSEAAGPPADEGTSSALPRPLDTAEIPGRHKRASSRSPPTESGPAPSIAAPAEASEPASAPAGAEESARSRLAAADSASPRGKPAVTEPAEPPATKPAEPLVVAMAPEPTAATPATAARDAEGQAAEPKPTPPQAAAESSSKQPVKTAAVAPRDSRPEEAASSEVVRAEIPSLRVESTVWHPLAERRVALIEFDQTAERREIHEGDAVGPLVVSKIEPSGVVFVHDGVEIRRRVGE